MELEPADLPPPPEAGVGGDTTQGAHSRMARVVVGLGTERQEVEGEEEEEAAGAGAGVPAGVLGMTAVTAAATTTVAVVVVYRLQMRTSPVTTIPSVSPRMQARQTSKRLIAPWPSGSTPTRTGTLGLRTRSRRSAQRMRFCRTAGPGPSMTAYVGMVERCDGCDHYCW